MHPTSHIALFDPALDGKHNAQPVLLPDGVGFGDGPPLPGVAFVGAYTRTMTDYDSDRVIGHVLIARLLVAPEHVTVTRSVLRVHGDSVLVPARDEETYPRAYGWPIRVLDSDCNVLAVGSPDRDGDPDAEAVIPPEAAGVIVDLFVTDVSHRPTPADSPLAHDADARTTVGRYGLWHAATPGLMSCATLDPDE